MENAYSSIFATDQRQEWMRSIQRMQSYDFYHLPEYHQIAEQRGEGKGLLFVLSKDEYEIALPLLQRNILTPNQSDDGHDTKLTDLTSVYGYAGVLTSSADIPGEIMDALWEAFASELQKMKVVSVFLRGHPLLSQTILEHGPGRVVPTGETVAIDLTVPFEAARSGYRKSHRRGINKLKRQDVSCILDAEKVHLDEFIEIYLESMHRVQAPGAYFFDRSYFEALVSHMDPWMHLFVCKQDGVVLCAGLYSICNGIVQAHLGGVRSDALKLSPTKLETEAVHRWGCEQNARLLHLGGGVGAQDDSLFEFKSGFSSIRYLFSVWQYVVDPEIYDSLCTSREDLNSKAGLIPVSDSYFPKYRCPTKSSHMY